jgi:hypothetical protein
MEQLLERMRDRGAMYLWGFDKHRFESLVSYLQGYGRSAASARFWEFTGWLKSVKQLEGDRPTGWPGILSVNYATEEERYAAFFVLFEEFLLENPEPRQPQDGLPRDRPMRMDSRLR